MEHIPALEQSAYDASLEPTAAPASSAAAPASAAADLAELLALDVGGGAAAAPQPAAAVAANALADMLGDDLLGGGAQATAAPPAAAPALAAAADPLADLFGGGGAAATPPPPAAATITAFEKGALSIQFVLTKSPANPALTDIAATYTNLSAQPITDFTLQVGPGWAVGVVAPHGKQAV